MRLLKKGPLHGLRTMNAVFLAAEEEARRIGEVRPEAEHLVLAAFDMSDGSARRAFERVGAEPAEFRAALTREHASALRKAGVENTSVLDDLGTDEPSGNRRPFTTAPPTLAARKVFKAAARRARKNKTDFSSAYILLAAAETATGSTGRAFRSMGLDTEGIVAAALAEIELLGTAPNQ